MDDVVHAVEFLVTFPGVNSKNITIVGHSEGTLIATYASNNVSSDIYLNICHHSSVIIFDTTPMVPQVALLSGPGIPMTEVVIDQLERAIIWAQTILDSCIAAKAPFNTIISLEQQLAQSKQLYQQTITLTNQVLNGTYAPYDLVSWIGSTTPVVCAHF